MRLDVALSESRREARGGLQGLKALLNALFKQAGALGHGLAGFDAFRRQRRRGGGQLGAEAGERVRQLLARNRRIGCPCARWASSAFAVSSRRLATASCRASKALGQGGVLRGLALGQGTVKRREALLQTAFKPGEGGKQLRAAIARFGHGLGQALVHRAAHPSSVVCVVCVKPRSCCPIPSIAPSFLATASWVVCAVCSSACRRASHSGGRSTRAAQQDHQQNQHQGHSGQQNEGIGSQGRFTMF